MRRHFYTQLIPHFDPKLTVGDDALYVERQDSPLRCFQETRVDAMPRPGLLVGAFGSGKSTELLRLARAVAAEPDPPLVGLVPLREQCEVDELTAPQVLFLIGLAALRLAPGRPPAAHLTRLERAYRGIVHEGDELSIDSGKLLDQLIVVGGGLLKSLQPGLVPLANLGRGLASGLRGLPQLAIPGRGRLLQAKDPPAEALALAVEEAVAWVQSQYGGQDYARMALFVDGLDKLRLQEKVDEVFDSPILARPRVRGLQVVHSAPISLYYGVRGQALKDEFAFLPIGNFRVFRHEPAGAPDPDGFRRMREVFRRRFAAAGLSPETVVAGGLEPGGPLDVLIRTSGGVTRLIIRLFGEAMRYGCVGDRASIDRLEVDDIAAVVTREEQDMARALSLHQELLPALLECWRTGKAPERGAPVLLFHNLVLCYRNEFDWFRPAPALDRYLRLSYPDEVPPLPGT